MFLENGKYNPSNYQADFILLLILKILGDQSKLTASSHDLISWDQSHDLKKEQELEKLFSVKSTVNNLYDQQSQVCCKYTKKPRFVLGILYIIIVTGWYGQPVNVEYQNNVFFNVLGYIFQQ